MNNKDRKVSIQTLCSKAEVLQTELDELRRQRVALDLEVSREDHPCSCVKLNKDIEIYDTMEQERRGRVGLSLGGWVSETLSARKDCEYCKGKGIPTKHTHFGEILVTDGSCPACTYSSTHPRE